MRKFLSIFLLTLVLTAGAAAVTPAQEKLMKAEADKLKEINRQVLASIGDLTQYDNQTIYVRVKLVPQGDDKFKVKIEDISPQKPAAPSSPADEKIIVVKGNVVQGAAREFKLDLEYVLPPPADKEGNEK